MRRWRHAVRDVSDGCHVRSHCRCSSRAHCRYLSNVTFFPHIYTEMVPFTPPPVTLQTLPSVVSGRIPLSNVQDKTDPYVPAKCVQKATFELRQGRYRVPAKCPLVPFVDFCHICRYLSLILRFPDAKWSQIPPPSTTASCLLSTAPHLLSAVEV